ncbi:hypothetical protein M758_4G213200 [Ceratodon purpureus]|nr:hypothetical protein M758_4G213200 [Ceratodon purpureus]
MFRIRAASRMLGIAVVLHILLAHLAVAGNAEDSDIHQQEFVSEALSQRDGATTRYSADGWLKCVSDLHITPTSTEEISELIKLHTSGDKPVKIRASRRGYHSTAGFGCPGERGSTKLEYDADAILKIMEKASEVEGVTSITMLLHSMNHVVSVDAEHHQLTVEAGMTLFDLADAAEANNMSVLAGAFSIYGNLTVGGVISTSAHGSGLGTTCSLGDLVTKMKWVNAKGDIIVSDAQTEQGAMEVRALVGGLGLLGIITEFTLQLQPPSLTVVESRNDLDDSHIVPELKAMLTLETPHIISHWRPDLGMYRATLFTHVGSADALPASAPPFDPNARTVYMAAVDDRIASNWSEMMAAWGNDMAMDSNSTASLNADACTAGAIHSRVPFTSDGNGVPVDHATVSTHRAMLAAECSPKCGYQQSHMGAVSEDIEFTIKLSQFDEWVQDVKAIVKTELAESESRLQTQHNHNIKSCLPPGAFWLRFGKGTNTLLSTNTGTEDVVFVQWTLMTSAMTPRIPGKHASISETIEQLSLCKYKARPHWGKNHERQFRHPRCHVRDNFPDWNIEQMIALQEQHDPDKVLEPALFRHVVRRTGPEYSALCTLQQWCYCSADAHCAPDYRCVASPAFPLFKVCRLRPRPPAPPLLHDEF